MKPGIVLISLTRTSPSGSTKKSQRARPEQPPSSEGLDGELAHAGRPARRRSAPGRPAPSRPRCTWSRSRTSRRGRRPRPAARPRPRSLPSSEHSTSRPLAEASTITRGSWRQRQLDRRVELVAERLDPADADAGAEPRGLHPERQAHRRAALAPALLAGRDELDLGHAALRRRAASGSACPCRSPRRGRRSRRRGGRATRAGPGRCRPRRRGRAGPGRRRRRRAGRRPGASSTGLAVAGSSRPSRAIVTRSASWPASSRPARHRLARSAARRRARRSGRRRGPRPSFFGRSSGSASEPPGAACRRRRSPSSPGSTSEPGGGNWSVTRPTCEGTSVSCSCTVGLQAGFAQRFDRFGAQLADHVRHLRLLFALGDDDRDGRAARRARMPALGAWRITSPAGFELCFFGDAGDEAAAADLLHGDRALRSRPGPAPWPASGPLETVRVDGRAAGRGRRRREGSEWITSPASTASELTSLDLRLRSRLLRASSASSPAAGRRSRAPWRCRGRC